MSEDNGQQTQKYHVLHADQQSISDQRIPAQPAGVWAVLGMIANRLKTITGKASWTTSPDATLADAATHHGRTDNPHSVTRGQIGAAAASALSSHTADQSNPHGVTAAQAGARPASYVPAWTEVTNKPSTYPSTWNTVSGKPSTYPPATHRHDDIYPAGDPSGASADQVWTYDTASGTWLPKSLPPGGGVPEGGSVGQVVGKIGAGDYETGWINPASGYDTDGSTPLKYSAFLREAGDHQVAMQNAINALYTGSGDYQRHLDLEGATVVLREQVSAPASGFQVRSIYNGEILAHSDWSTNEYLLSFMGAGNQHLRFVNVTFIGSNRCSWVEWDDGDFLFDACHFRNNNPNGDPGLRAVGDAHYHVRNCHATVNEGSTPPDQRTHIGFYATKGDQKLTSTTMSYFRHSIVNEGGTFTIDNLHVFQGVSGSSSTVHTAGIKLTGGYVGTLITNLYLDKCFIEVSNESNPNALKLGGLRVIGVTTLLDSEDPNFAYVVVRDYHSKTGLPVENVTIKGGEWVNYGSTLAKFTTITPSANFNRNAFKGINVKPNNFVGQITPQANPLTMRKTFTSSTQHQFDVSGYLPFDARLSAATSAEGVRSGSDIPIIQPSINAAQNIVNLYTSTAWGGEMIMTATTNPPSASGFVES